MLAFFAPNGAALRLFLDAFPLKELRKDYKIAIICREEIVSNNLKSFCNLQKIKLIISANNTINKTNLIKRIFRNYRAYLSPSTIRNNTIDDFWNIYKYENSHGWITTIKLLLIKLAIYSGRRNREIRKLLSFLEELVTNTSYEENILTMNKITHLLTTSISGVDCNDTMILGCKRRGIKSITYIQSWDNPSGNGYRLCIPNKILVYSSYMKEQLINFQDVDKKIINITGCIQYHSWINIDNKSYANKRKNNNRLRVLYAGKSCKRFSYDHVYCKEVISCLKELKLDYKLIIRPHPLSLRKSNDGEFKFKNEMNDIFNIGKNNDDVDLDIEKVSGFENIYYKNNNTFNHMKERLMGYDLIINVFSTVALEACILNKPCINMNYETAEYKYKKFPTRKNLFIDERQFHNSSLMHAVPTAKSYENLKLLIKEAFDFPDKRKKEMKNVSKLILGDIIDSSNKFIQEIKIFTRS